MAFFPLANKSYASMAKMKAFQPQGAAHSRGVDFGRSVDRTGLPQWRHGSLSQIVATDAPWRPGAIQEESFGLLNARNSFGTPRGGKPAFAPKGRARHEGPIATGFRKKPLCDVAHSSEMGACPKLKPIIVA